MEPILGPLLPLLHLYVSDCSLLLLLLYIFLQLPPQCVLAAMAHYHTLHEGVCAAHTGIGTSCYPINEAELINWPLELRLRPHGVTELQQSPLGGFVAYWDAQPTSEALNAAVDRTVDMSVADGVGGGGGEAAGAATGGKAQGRRPTATAVSTGMAAEAATGAGGAGNGKQAQAAATGEEGRGVAAVVAAKAGGTPQQLQAEAAACDTDAGAAATAAAAVATAAATAVRAAHAKLFSYQFPAYFQADPREDDILIAPPEALVAATDVAVRL